ncbi:hypothetical protein ES705_41166 [subsurface metagenome]
MTRFIAFIVIINYLVFQILNSHIRRIPNYCIKTPIGKYFRESIFPIKSVYLFKLFREKVKLVVVKVISNKGISAFNIIAQIGQHSFVKEGQLLADGCLCFAFQCFEQQIQLSYFNGLCVNVNAKNVVDQDALLFRCG